MSRLPDFQNCSVSVIGLGYVGLPLALQIANTNFCKATKKKLNRKVFGFDIDIERIENLQKNFDSFGEFEDWELKDSSEIKFTNNLEDLKFCDVFIITVPTPIDKSKRPNLKFLEMASKSVAKILSLQRKIEFAKTPIVLYESTVYPGLTEEFCIPIIEKNSKLVSNYDFFYGYSPERINPGDKSRKIDNIIKVTSGSDKLSSDWIDSFYASFIKAGTHKTKNIKIAEAAKVIENTQRDINIALINELAMIFDLMDIDTLDVLEAAKTKWNFQYFKPGLVGGHCIGVDPYYLTYKSEILGYRPEMLLSGRRINDGFAKFIVDKLVLSLIKRKIVLPTSEILVLGITFKENCADIRNTKVKNIIERLDLYGTKITVVDPYADKNKCREMMNINISSRIPENKKFDAVVVAVAHKYFCEIKISLWKKLIKEKGVILDLKGIVHREINPLRL